MIILFKEAVTLCVLYDTIVVFYSSRFFFLSDINKHIETKKISFYFTNHPFVSAKAILIQILQNESIELFLFPRIRQ